MISPCAPARSSATLQGTSSRLCSFPSRDATTAAVAVAVGEESVEEDVVDDDDEEVDEGDELYLREK